MNTVVSLLNQMFDRIEILASLAAIFGVSISFYYHYRSAKLRRLTHSYFIAIKILDVLNQSYLTESNQQRYLLNLETKNVQFELKTINAIIEHFIALFETIDDAGISESLQLKRLTIKMKLSLFIQSINPKEFKHIVEGEYAHCLKNILLFTFCDDLNDIKHIDTIPASTVIDKKLQAELEEATHWDKATFRAILMV